MSYWERSGKSNDWQTPKFIFDALGCRFDLDVAAPNDGPLYVPCGAWLSTDSLNMPWRGFVWMNPPFGGRNGLAPWLDKFFRHGSGIALVPDRTSAPWFQQYAPSASRILLLPKVRFIGADGQEGRSPSNGTALFAAGPIGEMALVRAHTLGIAMVPVRAFARPQLEAA